jgi:hypothetical protein
MPTGSVTVFGVIFTGTLSNPADSPADTYTWMAEDFPTIYAEVINLEVEDVTTQDFANGFSFTCPAGATCESGTVTLQFVPEPSSLGLMLAGVGMVALVMRKRIARGLSQAA